MMRTIALFCMVLLMQACGGPDKKAIESSKFDEVMAVHDEVMPKMSAIRKLKKSLEERLAATDSASTERADVEAMIVELEAASDSMMDWMRSFSEPEEGTPHDDVLKFYEGEMEKVMLVREKMLGAIEKAEKMQ